MTEKTGDRHPEEPEGDPSPGSSPFHEGEQRIQSRLGVRDEIEPWARQIISDALPDAHREFYARLPFLVVAARDDQGQPWVTLLPGEPGFVHSADPGELAIAALPAIGDPLHGALRTGADIGVLEDYAGNNHHNTLGNLNMDPYALPLRWTFCGPAAFLADLQRGLRNVGVPASQIHAESF